MVFPQIKLTFQKSIFRGALNSFDVNYAVNDIKNLQSILGLLITSIKTEAKRLKDENNWSVEKLYFLQNDYLIVWQILLNQNALPDDYKYPEYYLIQAMKAK